jgi:large subunit ribosomal protein L4
MKLDHIKTTSDSKKLKVTVSDELFDRPNPKLLAQAIRVYLANQRQGTSKVKTRGEVSRTTRKWYRQKGTGNARHGAKDANIFVGGGVSHGPTGLENWKRRLTAQFRKQALAAALTASSSNIYLNDEIENLSGKTKEAVTLLEQVVAKFNDKNKFKLSQNKLLIVTDQKTDQQQRALANIPNVTLISAKLLNALAVAKAHQIIITSKAMVVLESRIVQ